MGKIITIIGNSGVGKTTLLRKLAENSKLIPQFETHAERPFHSEFENNKHFALANQIDYLIFRTEQERKLKESGKIGILDGGLEMDYHIFTKLFYQKGYLKKSEFELCKRFYKLQRNFLGKPDLLIFLEAYINVIKTRFKMRNRKLEITELDDILLIEKLIDEYKVNLESIPKIIINANYKDYLQENAKQMIIKEIFKKI